MRELSPLQRSLRLQIGQYACQAQLHSLRHQPEEQVDVELLPEQERELGFLKRGQQLLGELFSFDRYDADRRIIRHAAAEDRHERLARLACQRRGRSGIHAEIERRGDIRDAGEVDGLMPMGGQC